MIALFFALHDVYDVDEPCPIVWMLNPFFLNAEEKSINNTQLPLSWKGHDLSNPHEPACPENIMGAFERDEKGCFLPIALYPQHIHPRVTAQRSCFTVHGKEKKSIEELYNPLSAGQSRDFSPQLRWYSRQSVKYQRRTGQEASEEEL
ncbi:hypothetical protein E3J38_06485 [candidate division TA06 bacterium]|uniref:Uncharacterized protein n=1 Tax=candidate division TA06 bacterium TaxID=2250710 RepID=A0A523XLA4_UNCT6|nr:MAG: hypothetical protein E3J38_06485 [candidate division TA06 bacterium]